MANTIKTACIQLNNGPDVRENLKNTEQLIREAAGDGVKLIATPENTCFMVEPPMARLAQAQGQDDNETLKALRSLADELGVWILIGSLGIKLEKRKIANRSFLISDKGEIVTTYDKIHLFDVDLPNGERYRESAIIQPGDEAVVAQGPGTKIGLSICYDIRFSHLYRDLAKRGAEILTVPAAFSMLTGQAHWEVLLRARAIETGSFVLAPGQAGLHDGGRSTWGHSMIINPWGEILAAMDSEVGIISADLNMDDVEKARQAIPALKHDRDYALKS